MKGNSISNIFKRFLKENGAYAQYRKEFIKQKGQREKWIKSYKIHFKHDVASKKENYEPPFDAFCKNIKDKENILNFSFIWADSNFKDARLFWECLRVKWQGYCKSNKL